MHLQIKIVQSIYAQQGKEGLKSQQLFSSIATNF